MGRVGGRKAPARSLKRAGQGLAGPGRGRALSYFTTTVPVMWGWIEQKYS
jgi:hypothetical protein